jgi:hypothetical protein
MWREKPPKGHSEQKTQIRDKDSSYTLKRAEMKVVTRGFRDFYRVVAEQTPPATTSPPFFWGRDWRF